MKAQIKHLTFQVQHFKRPRHQFLSHVGSETSLSLQFAVTVCVTVQVGLCRSWSKTVCVSSYKVKVLILKLKMLLILREKDTLIIKYNWFYKIRPYD